MIQHQEKLFNQQVPQQQLSMRIMDLNDLMMVLGWCKSEGWNVGQYDAEIYYKAAPHAHMLFLLNEEPIGAISIVKYSDSFFTLGPFIVKKEHRRKGYGSQIWHTAIETVDNMATTALFSVPAQVSRYRESGFESKFLVQRWELFSSPINYKKTTSACQLIEPVNLLEVSVYDQSIFGSSRYKLLKKLIKTPYIQSFFLKQENEVCGFGIIRPCSLKGFRVGPLFANTAENAKELFSKLIDVIDLKEIIIDIPSSNQYANLFAEYFNLSPVSENDTEAMFRGDLPEKFLENIDKNYAIFSLEIG